MNPPRSPALRQLLDSQRVAAIGTLHDGEPFVSMVPFALLPGGRFVVHVSGLAAHTQDMKGDPRVSLLVVAPHAPGERVHALARVTVRGGEAGLPRALPPVERAVRARRLLVVRDRAGRCPLHRRLRPGAEPDGGGLRRSPERRLNPLRHPRQLHTPRIGDSHRSSWPSEGAEIGHCPQLWSKGSASDRPVSGSSRDV
jgi:hypothetical protein